MLRRAATFLMVSALVPIVLTACTPEEEAVTGDAVRTADAGRQPSLTMSEPLIPVQSPGVPPRTLTDHMEDVSLLHEHKKVRLETGEPEETYRGANRLIGTADSYVIYRAQAPIRMIRVRAFLPEDSDDLLFSVSADGEKFKPFDAMRVEQSGNQRDSAGGKSVLYQGRRITATARFMKIEFAARAEISKVEIDYGGSTLNLREIADFRKEAREELTQNILGYWTEHCVDEVNGGFVGRVTNDNSVMENAPKGLVLNARILWTYAAAYRMQQKKTHLRLADRAYEYLVTHFFDRLHGGAFWLLDAQGNPIDDSKEMYGQSFVIYALAEYHRATGNQQALSRAKQLFTLLDARCHDDANKGYFETFTRNWQPAPKARLASGAANETKTMNTHLHLLEAWTNLYRVWKNDHLYHRLRELIDIFAEHIIDPRSHHFKLFFDDQWNSTKPVVSYGHDIEGSWLLCEAAEVLGDETVIEHIRPIALNMAEAVYERGFDTDGGLFYEAEHRTITIAARHWWPQAETVVGFINAYQLSDRPAYLQAAVQCWQFIRREQVDHEHGEWFSLASDHGRRNSAWKVSEWKAPYHNGRACMETVRRLNDVLQRER